MWRNCVCMAWNTTLLRRSGVNHAKYFTATSNKRYLQKSYHVVQSAPATANQYFYPGTPLDIISDTVTSRPKTPKHRSATITITITITTTTTTTISTATYPCTTHKMISYEKVRKK
ncbi:hypothetical protein E2C01_004071 [Portunus trituberculatus]|uniref:Uncharacterized protein n=1 Tax=Portunus trituberculatus TaxID=210409 RepID=A0A5B7CNW3_PORTR|nr:hypothetical protein [Portunus trituberculatus]